jgi:hypothetical protein
MTLSHAIDVLTYVRENIEQPVNTPLPPSVPTQFPRYYLLTALGWLFEVVGIRRNLKRTKWYISVDLRDDAIITHGYWHPKIIDNIIEVLRKAEDDP